eukprot:6046104-Prymnesium_polylepis.1
MAPLQLCVAALEEENARLWHHVQRGVEEGQTSGVGSSATSMRVVSTTGESRDGRQLSGGPSTAPTCCRWTWDDACGSSGNANTEACTDVHEYLEHKTTTHEFNDLDTCLGADHTKWKFRYDSSNAQIALSNDSPVTTVKTSLKVTHAASCSNTAPSLTLQMDTVVSGALE